MTRFEIKPTNQNKCPYCQFPPDGYGKDFMVQVNNEEECMTYLNMRDISISHALQTIQAMQSMAFKKDFQ